MALLRTLLALSAITVTTYAIPVSSSCTTAVNAVLANSTVSACLNPASLVPLVVNGQVVNTSVLSIASSWLDTMCSLPECSTNTIAWGVNTVVSGCQKDILSALSGSNLLGGDPSKLSVIATVAPNFYPAARKLACLWESGQNCAIKSFTAFETFVGKPLSIPNLVTTFIRLTSGRFLTRPGTPDGPVSPDNIIDTHDPASGYGIYFDFDQAPTDLICTSCVKAGFNTIRGDVLSDALLLTDNVQPHLQDKCGAAFIGIDCTPFLPSILY